MSDLKKNVYSESSDTPSQIEELFEHVRSFRRFPKGYRAIHMHFSVLDRLHQQPHHRRTIATAFNKLVNSFEGKLFWLKNFDFFFVCRNCSHTQLETAKLEALRAVEDSPILKTIINQNTDNELSDIYDLAVEYQKFFDLIEQIRLNPSQTAEKDEETAPSLKNLMANLDKNGEDKIPIKIKVPLPKIENDNHAIQKAPRTVPNYEHIFPKSVNPPMGPMQLDKLERNLLTMDMFALIEEQNICVVFNRMPPEVIFTKKYISLAEINKLILPNYNISEDRWLFQRLTRTFDKKLMQALIDNKSFPDQVLSININVATILTKEFDKFLSVQKALSNNTIILEITLFDIMSDLNEFYKAREKLDKHGCKVCICKMDIQSLLILNRDLINVDFLKIRWNKVYQTVLSNEDQKKIAETIESQGKMRVVLSDCDCSQAMDFGNSVGIVMYQGFEIDKLQGL